MEEIKENLSKVKAHMEKVTHLTNALNLIYWDMRVGMPKNALEQRSQLYGYLSGQLFKESTSIKIKEYLDFFSDKMDTLSFIDRRMIEELNKEYKKLIKIPEDRNKAYTILCSKSEAVWEEAKNNNDFESFKPYLEQMLEFTKEFANYVGYEGDIYNYCLDCYEPGLTVELTDRIFKQLKDGILKLLNKIKNSNMKINTSFFKKYFSEKAQEEFGKYILEKLGFDFNSGRLDVTVHPFTINMGNKDVRITTNYDEHEFRIAFFSNVHEGGHGIYEQNIKDDLLNTGLQQGASMGIHESQSRYYENILGRSKEFWKYFYNETQKKFPQLKSIDFHEFYKGINEVVPSLIRVDADELTYSLHIIIRYELERALLNGELEVKDLPKAWNEKYKSYLGIEPTNYSNGVLQDCHWSSGLIGYFPSYALGNIYGAQFYNTMKKNIKDLDKVIEEGGFQIIDQWLKDNIHQYGKLYSPVELIKRVTGEELNAQYFLNYLNDKYAEIYNLN